MRTVVAEEREVLTTDGQDWYRDRIAYHERELDDLDNEYRHKRAEIERALAHLSEEVARGYPNG